MEEFRRYFNGPLRRLLDSFLLAFKFMDVKVTTRKDRLFVDLVITTIVERYTEVLVEGCEMTHLSSEEKKVLVEEMAKHMELFVQQNK